VPEMATAGASVTTGAPARHARQLASHLGRRAEVRDEPDGTRLDLGSGSCLIVVGDDVLELRAEGESDHDLARVTEVVGSHLERVELTVTGRSA
jgi:uncharacterized protein